MAYNNNIPQATDLLNQSQPQLLENFAQIQSLIGINHATFNTANAGKHNFVSMPIQVANPGTTASEMALYTKTSLLSAVPEAFIQRADASVVEFTSSGQATTGWTRDASGVLHKWGQSNGTGSVAVNLSFAGAPVGISTFIGFVVPCTNGVSADPNTMATVISWTATTLNVWCGQRTTTGASAVTFNWYVIGN